MAGVEEENRKHIALFLLVVGVGLILVGIFLMIRHYHQIDVHQTPLPQTSVDKKLRAIQQILFLLIVLVIIFSTASIAFLRWSRRFRRWIFYKPQPATPDEDVWAMHRLPPEFGEDSDKPRQDAPPPEDG